MKGLLKLCGILYLIFFVGGCGVGSGLNEWNYDSVTNKKIAQPGFQFHVSTAKSLDGVLFGVVYEYDEDTNTPEIEYGIRGTAVGYDSSMQSFDLFTGDGVQVNPMAVMDEIIVKYELAPYKCMHVVCENVKTDGSTGILYKLILFNSTFSMAGYETIELNPVSSENEIRNPKVTIISVGSFGTTALLIYEEKTSGGNFALKAVAIGASAVKNDSNLEINLDIGNSYNIRDTKTYKKNIKVSVSKQEDITAVSWEEDDEGNTDVYLYCFTQELNNITLLVDIKPATQGWVSGPISLTSGGTNINSDMTIFYNNGTFAFVVYQSWNDSADNWDVLLERVYISEAATDPQPLVIYHGSNTVDQINPVIKYKYYETSGLNAYNFINLVVIVFQEQTGVGGISNFDICATAVDPGNLINKKSIKICNELGDQHDLSISENMIISWIDDRLLIPGGNNSDVYSQQLGFSKDSSLQLSDFGVMWKENGVEVCTNDARQTDCVVVADTNIITSNTDGLVVWHDYRENPTQSSIYCSIVSGGSVMRPNPVVKQSPDLVGTDTTKVLIRWLDQSKIENGFKILKYNIGSNDYIEYALSLPVDSTSYEINAADLNEFEFYLFDVVAFLQNEGHTSLSPVIGSAILVLKKPAPILVHGEVTTDSAQLQILNAGGTAEIFRATGEPTNFEMIAIVSDVVYIDSTIQPGIKYYYKARVKKVDLLPPHQLFFSEFSNILEINSTSLPPIEPVKNEVVLNDPEVISEGIKLKWSYELDYDSPFFEVERMAEGGTFYKVTSLKDTTFVDTDLEDSVTYTYRIRASDGGGNIGVVYSSEKKILFKKPTFFPTSPVNPFPSNPIGSTNPKGKSSAGSLCYISTVSKGFYSDLTTNLCYFRDKKLTRILPGKIATVVYSSLSPRSAYQSTESAAWLHCLQLIISRFFNSARYIYIGLFAIYLLCLVRIRFR
ncbi:MAG: hypothetical protein HY606_15040 [Planctomycetes bacterium]|nr:hypothetical protein [Planctomycetota bacterium]